MYESFDPFKQAKLQQSYARLNTVSVDQKELSLDELKRLSGVAGTTGEMISSTQNYNLASEKAQHMRDRDIRPGTDAWFKLWFAKPHLTGENPI